jgi:hypothetical protein
MYIIVLGITNILIVSFSAIVNQVSIKKNVATKIISCYIFIHCAAYDGHLH